MASIVDYLGGFSAIGLSLAVGALVASTVGGVALGWLDNLTRSTTCAMIFFLFTAAVFILLTPFPKTLFDSPLLPGTFFEVFLVHLANVGAIALGLAGVGYWVTAVVSLHVLRRGSSIG